MDAKVSENIVTTIVLGANTFFYHQKSKFVAMLMVRLSWSLALE